MGPRVTGAETQKELCTHLLASLICKRDEKKRVTEKVNKNGRRWAHTGESRERLHLYPRSHRQGKPIITVSSVQRGGQLGQLSRGPGPEGARAFCF